MSNTFHRLLLDKFLTFILNAVYRSLFIQTLDTPNHNALKFVPGLKVMGDRGTKQIENFREASVSPLARDLFKIDGIKSLLLGPDFVSINKKEEFDWEDLKLQIFDTITTFYESGKDILSQEDLPSDTAILPEDDEVVASIKELIDTRVRPGVQEDGGDIEYKVRFEFSLLFLLED